MGPTGRRMSNIGIDYLGSVRRLVIPEASLRAELEDSGITRSFVFPDLEASGTRVVLEKTQPVSTASGRAAGSRSVKLRARKKLS